MLGSDSRDSTKAGGETCTPEDFLAAAEAGGSEAIRTVTGSCAPLSGLDSGFSTRTEAGADATREDVGIVLMRGPGGLFEIRLGEAALVPAREGRELKGTGVVERSATISAVTGAATAVDDDASVFEVGPEV